MKGKVARPIYESRLVGLLAQPERLFTTAAQALDYQFGFKVSETWFFQLLERRLPVLLLAQLAVLLLSTCVVFIDAGEQAVLEHFGKRVGRRSARARISSWPWPMDKIYRFRTEQIQTFASATLRTRKAKRQRRFCGAFAMPRRTIFSSATARRSRFKMKTPTPMTRCKAPPVSLITVSVPVQFQITNVMAWAYNNADATNLLQ